MYWIEMEEDGSYIYNGQEYLIPIDDIQELESHESERHGNEWAKIITPFELETEHGRFTWEIQIIEYFDMNVVSFLGFTLTELPSQIILKEEITFRIQDGWISPTPMKVK